MILKWDVLLPRGRMIPNAGSIPRPNQLSCSAVTAAHGGVVPQVNLESLDGMGAASAYDALEVYIPTHEMTRTRTT